MKILYKIRALFQLFDFTNKWSLITQRIFFSAERFTCYQWESYYILCDRKFHDDSSVKELICEKIYHESIKSSNAGDGYSYVNIGGNIGVFDIVVNALVGKVNSGLTFEVNPETFERLNQNLRINGLKNITAYPVGVGSKEEEIDINDSEHSTDFGLYTKAINNRGRLIRCQIKTLDSLLKNHVEAGATFNLLKIDCEGAEYDLVRVVKSETLSIFNYIIIEIHAPRDGENIGSIIEKIKSCNFTEVALKRSIKGVFFFKKN